MFKHMITLAAVAGLVLALAGAATHGAVITPDAVGASMCYDWGSNRTGALINGLGLNQTGWDVSTWTHDKAPPHAWINGEWDDWRHQWLNNTGVEVVAATRLWFFFDEPTDIYKVYLWQYTTNLAQGLKDFTVWGSTDAGAEGYIVGNYNDTPYTFTALSGLLTMASSPVGPSVTQTFDLSNPGIGLRIVRISIASSHGDAYVGLAEARFDNTPEPATLALLGLGGIGLILRRKRR